MTGSYSSNIAMALGKYGTAILRLLPPETSHNIGMKLLSSKIFDYMPKPQKIIPSPALQMNIPGIGTLPHPIGLAAGFDKHGQALPGFMRLGLSFLEVGTITPQPQAGNPKPRMFRYPEQQAIINRMGFNSHGSHTVKNRLQKLNWDHHQIPYGINLGKNKSTPAEAAIEDFHYGLETFAGMAQYYVINISSPNTEGLRDLANEDFIRNIASAHRDKKNKIWFKLDPDMSRPQLQSIVSAICEEGLQGVILSNTHKVSLPEQGGQSGHPLTALSCRALERAYDVHKGSLPMIASGGILSGLDILERVARGACAVQIYSALVYRGPWVVLQLIQELEAELENRNLSCLADAIGTHYN